MNAFCKIEDLVSESDVEQKLVWGVLTRPHPMGAGHVPAEIKTKVDIRRLEIGKGKELKIYYPDYLILINGLPMMIVEVKTRREDLVAAEREARLYATEVNGRFPSKLNPCLWTVVTNGDELALHASDSAMPLHRVKFAEMYAEHPEFTKILNLIQRDTLLKEAEAILRKIKPRRYKRPIDEVGGATVRNEELKPNSFGASLALNYRHLFNPVNHEDRARIVREAYIRSQRRERYVQSIDRVIRVAAPPSVSDARQIEDTENPRELTTQLRDYQKLTNQVLLLIGAVGAGKSTFVDYLQEVSLPPSVRAATVWVRINLNFAPVDKDKIYDWVADETIGELRKAHPEDDFDDFEVIEQVYKRELHKFKRGPLKPLKPDSSAYNERLSDEIARLQKDRNVTIKGMERFICANRGKLLVVVLDNCDKRTRDEQLLMFQVAQWIQGEFRCLVVLPIRDVTYDHHRHEPPLDTALKDLVYRIEAPSFQKVIDARIRLALEDIGHIKNKTSSYVMGDGIRVEYSNENLAKYLERIRKALFQEDSFARNVITGIAGGDIRRAMELFLDFCHSHFIDEKYIFGVTASPEEHAQKSRQGNRHDNADESQNYGLPPYIVHRVLMRSNRRFYDGNQSYIKNLFQCDPSDVRPTHFLRIDILHWLHENHQKKGPNGFRGYHRIETLVSNLVARGYDLTRSHTEIRYLIDAMCIATEHQRRDHEISPADLITLAPAGFVHIDLLSQFDYIAACVEDTWLDDPELLKLVANRIGGNGYKGHFDHQTFLFNARDALVYFQVRLKDPDLPTTGEFLSDDQIQPLFSLDTTEFNLQRAVSAYLQNRPGHRRRVQR